jgi:hypothetical protein
VPLTMRGKNPTNVFRLLGADENSATFALGWTLDRSPTLLARLVTTIFGSTLDSTDAVVALQRWGADRGYTDLEIQSGRAFHAVLEAKRDWELPSEGQLKRYVPRLAAARARRRRLVTVSAADADFAARGLPARIGGARRLYLSSWGDLARLAREALAAARKADERFWLRQWMLHLREFVAMERRFDNNVFVVSLGVSPMVDGGSLNVVEKSGRYFHPVGHMWPVQPPNYLGFRYRGALQSVRHVDAFEVVENLSKCDKRWPPTDRDYFVYKLGPPMRVAKPVRTSALYRNARVWCAIDTLLSGAFETIAEARNETKRRLEEMA